MIRTVDPRVNVKFKGHEACRSISIEGSKRVHEDRTYNNERVTDLGEAEKFEGLPGTVHIRRKRSGCCLRTKLHEKDT